MSFISQLSKVFVGILAMGMFLLPQVVFANPVGEVAAVVQNATVERDGRRSYLQIGQTIALGDVITTGATGQVQIVFQDQTKIAMNINSQLVVEDMRFDSSATANQFTIGAVAGAFRFLSGDSDETDYAIRTPYGTTRVRGADFDLNVSSQGAVNIVTFRREVLLCNRTNQCAVIRGACAAAQLNDSGQLVIPQSRAERLTFLSNGFPYILRQDGLLRDFQTRTWVCRNLAARTYGSEMQSSGLAGGPQRLAPDDLDTGSPSDVGSSPGGGRNPNTGGAQAGNGTSAGLGGATADGVDAGLGGPSPPGNANAGDGGASAGVPGGNSGASAGGGATRAGSID